MNFTREPIIETIISPKDGYKLCVRNSRGSSVEEYFVDAIEVVSFGRAFFFRSLERPKAFLVPVTDYEVVEVKETRVALKNVSHERNIKIGGGREGLVKHAKESSIEESSDVIDDGDQASVDHAVEAGSEASVEARGDKKRDRRRHRRRRLAEERREWLEKEKQGQPDQTATSESSEADESVERKEESGKVSTAMFSSLIPPPTTLISDTIARYKEREELGGAFFSRNPQNDKTEEDSTGHEKDLHHDQEISEEGGDDDAQHSFRTETNTEDLS